ncbi:MULTISPECIES: hypothetical protein [Actinoplanes]|uniref:hypothetical protein n=1 Tax=Actinoplanes TaxID=1865 RepID=UPI0005F2ACB1|nr:MULTISPECIES: hypothetical protein [Actinoplanes]GLY01408.1 hypothetical protein Acsp01_17870 [Actinoplanes sp. NBRC 101535]
MSIPPGDPWGTPTPDPAPSTPVPAPVPAPSGPVIVAIAEIEVTSSTVLTPVGDFPLAGSQWLVTDHWFTERRTPVWAKIAAFAGICLTAGLSLFLLLVKESAARGAVHVTVTSGPRQYVARIPVRREDDIAAVNQQVNYVRSLAAL